MKRAAKQFTSLAISLTVCVSIVTAAPPKVHETPGGTSVIAFAGANNDTPCHRDASSGCDIYLGEIDLATGIIDNAVRLSDGINGGAGAQWFPALSPDGRWLAYTDGPNNRIVLVKLAGLTTFTIASAKFPAFSADSRRLYYSTPGADTIFSVAIGSASLPPAVLATSALGTDPSPVGSSSGDRHVVYHVEEPPSGIAVPYIHTLADGVNAIDKRMPCIRTGSLAATPCGHVSINAAMNKIGATGPGSTTFWMSEWDGAAWSAFSPTLNNAESAIAARDARFVVGTGRATFLGTAAWPSDNVLVSTAEAATGSSGSYTTTLARLFIVNLVASEFTPVTVTGYPAEHFQTAHASIGPPATLASLMPAFTDPTLTPGSSSIRAVHVSELRTAINTLRARNGLASFTWTDPLIAADATAVKTTHIIEMREALNAAYQAGAVIAPAYTDATLASGSSPVKAVHITELRAAALWLW